MVRNMRSIDENWSAEGNIPGLYVRDAASKHVGEGPNLINFRIFALFNRCVALLLRIYLLYAFVNLEKVEIRITPLKKIRPWPQVSNILYLCYQISDSVTCVCIKNSGPSHFVVLLQVTAFLQGFLLVYEPKISQVDGLMYWKCGRIVIQWGICCKNVSLPLFQSNLTNYE